MVRIAKNRLPALKSVPKLGVPWVVLGVTLLVGAAVWVYGLAAVRAREALQFRSDSRQVRETIVAQMEQQEALLQGAAGFFAAVPHPSRDAFRKFASRLDVQAAPQGRLGIGYSQRLTPGEIPALEQKIRFEGVIGFHVRPTDPRPEVHAIVQIEPANASNSLVLGFDMYTEPVRQAAMERARRSGEPAVTGRVTLLQDAGNPNMPGFLLYVPVYQGGHVPPSPESRHVSLMGFVFASYRAGELLAALLEETGALKVHVEVFEGRTTRRAALLYGTRPRRVPSPRLTETGTITVAQQEWTVRTSDRPGYEGVAGRRLVHLIPVGALALGGLLFGLTSGIVRAREAAERYADEARRAEARARLLARASEALSASLEPDSTLASVTRLVVPEFADWCTLDVASADGEIRRRAVAHVDPEKVRWAEELQERYPPHQNDARGVPHVIETGRSELYR